MLTKIIILLEGERMNRKKLIPLLLFLLLLLLIVCVWCHSGNIVKNRAIGTLPKQDIDFNFVKKANTLELKGHFSSDKSIQTLHTAMGNTQFTNLSSTNEALLAKEGVISLTQKLLLLFNEHYQEGSIVYANGTLTIEGVVENEAHKHAIDELLSHSNITSKNNTRVLPPPPTAEEEAQLEAKRLAQAEVKALAQKEADEKRKAQEAQAQLEAERLAQAEANTLAQKEAEEKKKAQEAQAKLEAEKLAQEKRKLLEAKMQEIIETEHITFELNKATLTEKSINTVSHIATILQENPQINVEIGGHTDSLGNDDYNLNLSQKRVNAVKAKLMSMEIDESRMKAVGYGETQALVSNDSKENRRKNRRVEFKILGE